MTEQELKWYVFYLVDVIEPVDDDPDRRVDESYTLFAAPSLAEATTSAREYCDFRNENTSDLTSDGIPTRQLYRGVRRCHILGEDGNSPCPEGQIVSSNRLRFKNMNDVNTFLDMEEVRLEFAPIE